MSSMPQALSEREIARQYELALQPTGDDDLDLSFLHSSFCLSGLPLRPLIDRKQIPTDSTLPALQGRRKEISSFHRRGSGCSLSINSPTIELPDSQRKLMIGVPWGARARILMLWITTQSQAQREDNRWLEFGSIRSWMNSVGIHYCTDSINSIKDQLIRLSFARFTILMSKGDHLYFDDDRLFEAGVVENQDLERYADGDMSNVRMPIGLKLSEKAFSRFTGKDAIPIPTSSLHSISNNPMAIDLFVYLCYRLRTIPERDTALISWKTLISQFGNGEHKSQFLQSFGPSISKAVDAMTCAKVEIDDEGLRIHHAPPAEFRRMFVVAPAAKKQTKVRTANRVLPKPSEPTEAMDM